MFYKILVSNSSAKKPVEVHYNRSSRSLECSDIFKYFSSK